MKQNIRSLPTEMIDRIQSALAANPSQMTLQLARKLGVPEAEVIRHMPNQFSVELDALRWAELFQDLPELGDVHVMVTNDAVTCEVNGQFGGFSIWGEFFNVQTDRLDMHLRHAQIGSIFAVKKPSQMEGLSTLSYQFYDRNGNSMLKIFVAFGAEAIPPERLALFEEIRDRYRVHQMV